MPKLIEFINHNSHTVKLAGPDKTIRSIPPRAKVVLPDFFSRYTPRYLRFVRYVGGSAPQNKNKKQARHRVVVKKKEGKTLVKPKRRAGVVTSGRKRAGHPTRSVRRSRQQETRRYRRHNVAGSNRNGHPFPRVGRAIGGAHAKSFAQAASQSVVPISNNIGIGILSYNRIGSLKRLIDSIKQYTNLNATTVFISDESTSLSVADKKYLSALGPDIVLIRNNKRLGIAGNSNRLLRCLSRFRYKIILNDDVEIMQVGWDKLYVDAMKKTDIHHFCYREIGVYGAKDRGAKNNVKGVQVLTIHSKPHGAIMAFDDTAFSAVGYFDEKFGIYGVEHVDWSERVGRHFKRPGFHDIAGSNKFFKIHKDDSAVERRTAHLQEARKLYGDGNSRPIRMEPTLASVVPAASVIIPYRNADGRGDDIISVTNNIRAMRYPEIEIILSEQDSPAKAPIRALEPIHYQHVPNKSTNQPFTKAMAFNKGVAISKHNKLVLHDADILAPGQYVSVILAKLAKFNGCHLGAKVYYLSAESSVRLNKTSTLSPNYQCNRIVGYFEGGSLGCSKQAYINCGGFNESYIGYGIEDCDFFERLKSLGKWCEDRSFEFFHLHHGRSPGWNQCHIKNKKIYENIKRKHNVDQYRNILRERLSSIYKM